MSFLELKTRSGGRFMIDFATGWEVLDKGNDAAVWCNHEQARNLDCGETYEALRAKLLPLPDGALAQLTSERDELIAAAREAIPPGEHPKEETASNWAWQIRNLGIDRRAAYGLAGLTPNGEVKAAGR